MLFYSFSCFILMLSGVKQLDAIINSETESKNQTSSKMSCQAKTEPVYSHLNYKLSISIIEDEDIFKGTASITFRPSRNLNFIRITRGDQMVITNIKKPEGTIESFVGAIYFLIGVFKQAQDYEVIVEYKANLSHGENRFFGVQMIEIDDESCDGPVYVTSGILQKSSNMFPLFGDLSTKASYELRLNKEGLSSKSYTFLSTTPQLSKSTENWIEFEKTPLLPQYALGFGLLPNCFRKWELQNIEVWGRTEDENITSYVALSASHQQDDFISSFNPRSSVFSPRMNNPEIDFSKRKSESKLPDDVSESRKILLIPSYLFYSHDYYSLSIYKTQYLEEDGARALFHVTGHSAVSSWIPFYATIESMEEFYLLQGLSDYYSLKNFDSVDVEEFFTDRNWALIHDAELAESQLLKYGKYLTGEYGYVYAMRARSFFSMLSSIVGEDNFEKAIGEVIKTFAGSTFSNEQFFCVFEDAVHMNSNGGLWELVKPWIIQPGYPVIKVSFVTGGVVVEQVSEKGLLWPIPLIFTTSENPNFVDLSVKHWLLNERESIPFENTPKWIIVNLNGTVYMEVSYSDEIINNIADELKRNTKVMPILQKALLISDISKQYFKRDLSFQSYMSFLATIIQFEDEYLPLHEAFNEFAVLAYEINTPSLLDSFKSYVQSILMRRMSSENLSKETQVEIDTWVDFYGSPNLTRNAKEYFDQWKINPNVSDEDLRYYLMCTALKFASREDLDFVLNVIKNTKYEDVELYLLSILFCTNDQAFKEERLFDLLREKDADKVENYLFMMLESDKTNTTWQFILNHYNESSDPKWTLDMLSVLTREDREWLVEVAYTYELTNPVFDDLKLNGIDSEEKKKKKLKDYFTHERNLDYMDEENLVEDDLRAFLKNLPENA